MCLHKFVWLVTREHMRFDNQETKTVNLLKLKLGCKFPEH